MNININADIKIFVNQFSKLKVLTICHEVTKVTPFYFLEITLSVNKREFPFSSREN